MTNTPNERSGSRDAATGLVRVTWDRNSDLMRTQLQETGRIRLSFISLDGLMAAVNDLGIDPAEVGFYRGYAVVGDAWKDIPA